MWIYCGAVSCVLVGLIEIRTCPKLSEIVRKLLRSHYYDADSPGSGRVLQNIIQYRFWFLPTKIIVKSTVVQSVVCTQHSKFGHVRICPDLSENRIQFMVLISNSDDFWPAAGATKLTFLGVFKEKTLQNSLKISRLRRASDPKLRHWDISRSRPRLSPLFSRGFG